jgi:hypothetical protein
MSEARTITVTLTREEFDALSIAAMEDPASGDLATARDALERAWVNADTRTEISAECPVCGAKATRMMPTWPHPPL